eukprot:4405605-Pleurochrysis_carterae.AAC.1
MGPRRASARGGVRVGSGRPDPAAHSRRQRAEVRSSTNNATPQAEASESTTTSTAAARTRASHTGSSTEPTAPENSPVSRARANKAKPVAEMTRSELEAAYARAVQQCNYAWRRERRRS